ncbi:MAG: aldehyde dehydrogenase family protein [Bacteroidetes bacterium]|nr:aldehyde dehydrogenase family protein [Bacteroidota bacterium]MCB9226783.1 aldehyde dehydrogenase family protein [Chitinophagales bacterium]
MDSVSVEEKVQISVPKSENDSLKRIQEVFELQKENLQTLKNSTAKDRKKKLKKLKDAIFSNREKIQEAIYKDFKKPALETDISEIYPTISELKHTLAHFEEWMEDEYVDTPITLIGSSAYVKYEPKGNCLIITPWNYPFYLAISPIIYAIASGNATMLKPSEFTPHTSLAVKELLAQVFNESEVAVILGDHTVSSALLKLKFDHIHFTGSPAVGKIIMKAASEHLTTCTLELGGKSPTIIDETANIKEAATKIVWGKYLNEGQTCIAPDYVLVHQSKKDELIKAMKEQIAKKYGKDKEARMQSGNLTRIVNSKHYNRLVELTQEAIEEGAVVETGATYEKDDNFIDPTILSNIAPHSDIMNEEIFGPIMPVIGFKSLDEALEIVNEKEKPLALYIFSKKEKNINYILEHTSAGGTCVNDTILHITQTNLPFGGINNSGIGKSHGKWGFVDFCNERSVLRQHLPFGMSQLMYPPYNKWTKKLIDITMKWF